MVPLFGIFLILIFAVLRIGAELFLPLAVALMLAVILQPLQRRLQKISLPRYLSAFLIIALLAGVVWVAASIVAGPATSWAERIPESIPDLKEKFHTLSRPVEKTQQLMTQAENITKGAGPQATTVAVQGTRLSDKVITGTSNAIGEVAATLMFLFFLLACGDTLLHKFIDVVPSFRNKRKIANIFHDIERDVSRYLMTITATSMAVGAITGLIMWISGLADPVLWGIAAYLFNYVPIAGPVVCSGIFLLVCFMEIPGFWESLAPPFLYLCVHITETWLVTPRLLAWQFTINPLIVVLSLAFWYWIWGFVGALLSVPMLVIIRIVCSRVERLKGFCHLLEG